MRLRQSPGSIFVTPDALSCNLYDIAATKWREMCGKDNFDDFMTPCSCTRCEWENAICGDNPRDNPRLIDRTVTRHFAGHSRYSFTSTIYFCRAKTRKNAESLCSELPLPPPRLRNKTGSTLKWHIIRKTIPYKLILELKWINNYSIFMLHLSRSFGKHYRDYLWIHKSI